MIDTTKPKIWVLADSCVGNANQAIALAENIKLGYELKPIVYNFWGNLPNFLLRFSPIHVKKELLQSWEIITDRQGFPDLIISAGRRTASLASYLKHKSNGRIKIVQIMHPNLPFKQFDLIILPHHDKVSKEELNMYSSDLSILDLLHKSKIVEGFLGETKPSTAAYTDVREERRRVATTKSPTRLTYAVSILRITGALNNVQAKIQDGGIELRKNHPKLGKFISVIIGGNSKNYTFTDYNARQIATILSNLIQKGKEYNLFISFSRRTPNSAKEIIKNNVSSSAIIYDPTEENTKPNPYFGMLSQADYIISTADSISMCSEAASTGKPLYIFCPNNFKLPKHLSFTQNLVELGIAKILDESVTQLEQYNYVPLNEVEKIANIIVSKNWVRS